MSLPLWERGLKSKKYKCGKHMENVAPLVGAWIEIKMWRKIILQTKSLPLWERGLKYVYHMIL